MRKLPEDVRLQAREMRRRGLSPLTISRQLACSRSWVDNVTRDIIKGESGPESEAAPVAVRPEPPAPVPQPDAPTRPQLPLLDLLRESLDRARDTAEQAKLDGNTPARQRAERDMVEITDQIRKATKAQAEDVDVIKYPREVLLAAMASVRERVTTLCNVPLTCQHCGRELRVTLASKDSEDLGES
jgi:hypothetical protein